MDTVCNGTITFYVIPPEKQVINDNTMMDLYNITVPKHFIWCFMHLQILCKDDKDFIDKQRLQRIDDEKKQNININNLSLANCKY